MCNALQSLAVVCTHGAAVQVSLLLKLSDSRTIPVLDAASWALEMIWRL